MASIVAVFYLDGVFFAVGHGSAPFWGGYSFVESEGGFGYSLPFVLALTMTRLQIEYGGESGVDPAVLGIRICFFFSWGNEW